MLEFTSVAGKIAGVVALAAYVPYVISMLRGHTKPSRAGWGIWTVVGILLAGSYFASGAQSTIWQALSYVLGPFVVFVLSIRYGEGGWTKLDKACLVGAALSIVAWWWFENPLIALIMNLNLDFCGAIPTIIKSYREPQKENRFGWILTATASVINMMAIDDWANPAIVMYPTYMLVWNGVIAILVCRPRKKPSEKAVP